MYATINITLDTEEMHNNDEITSTSMLITKWGSNVNLKAALCGRCSDVHLA